jgi:hypothetical protein
MKAENSHMDFNFGPFACTLFFRIEALAVTTAKFSSVQLAWPLSVEDYDGKSL